LRGISQDQVRALAEEKFKKKAVQAREAEKAMAEYVAAGVAERAKTIRLKALREAKEAAERDSKAKVKAKTTRVK
jgi:hypothetical protein